MEARGGVYDLELLSLFASHLGARQNECQIQEVSVSLLRLGMVFVEDVTTPTGSLLIARGHEVTPSLIERIRYLSRDRGVKEPLRAR